ncbi:hypothetical protein DSO57_1001993 [Entomophthora muscae]|uniref:Uncharacterized protein n=1 Tax=Entomophthora muscae TaxID=34485 RepID=A0ACC2RNS1_9FUNG|nr:hypothetical protein DSO57_1001993 [Entomophthora muscae]
MHEHATLFVRNDNIAVTEPQSMEPGSNPEQNPSWTTSSKDLELGSPQLTDNSPIQKVNVNLLGSKSSITPQGLVSELPVPNAGSFPEVPTLDTGSLLGEISKSTNVMEVTISNPAVGFKPTHSYQAGGAGERSSPVPGFALKSKYLCAGTTPALAVAVCPSWAPKAMPKPW